MNEEATMELAGSAWTLISFETDRGVIEASKEAPATLIFSAAGEQASGSSGCNRYVGSYTLTGNRFHIGPLASTRMMCDPVRMEQEDRFFQALSTAARCETSRQGELLIAYAGGTLRFASASPRAGGSTQP